MEEDFGTGMTKEVSDIRRVTRRKQWNKMKGRAETMVVAVVFYACMNKSGLDQSEK